MRTHTLPALLLVAAVTLSGCGLAPKTGPEPSATALTATSTPPASVTPDPVVDDMEAAAARTADFAQTLIGMTEEAADQAAVAAGYTTRVISREPGDSLAITMDYRTDRIDLTLRKGLVTEVSVG